MKKIYAVAQEWCIRGDAGHQMYSFHENIEDAFESLAEEVKSLLKNEANVDKCQYSEMHDADGNEITSCEIPDKLSYFLMQESEEWHGEYFWEYKVEEFDVCAPYHQRLIDLAPKTMEALSAITTFVKARQGEKGFINTSDSDVDVIWAMTYEGDANGYCNYSEVPVTAMRVKNNSLQLALDGGYDVSDDEIKDFDENDWTSIEDEYIYTAVTVLSILENLEYYFDEPGE